MSKIINKKQLDVLIESTLKEWNYNMDSHGMSQATGGFCEGKWGDPECMKYWLNTGHIHKKEYDDWEENYSQKTSEIKEGKGTMCECGGMVYEGECNECGTSYMKKGKKEEKIKNPGKYINGPRTEAGIDDDGDGVPNRADKKPKDGNVTEASVKDLAESVTKTFDASFLTENMDNFKKLINYRNK
jgi:hypothetical protein